MKDSHTSSLATRSHDAVIERFLQELDDAKRWRRHRASAGARRRQPSRSGG